MHLIKSISACNLLLITCLFVRIECAIISPADNQITREQEATKYTNGICPPEKIITGISGGRLGNVIWQYTTVIALSTLFPGSYKPYSNQYLSDRMDIVFENVNLPLIEDIPKSCDCCSGYNFSVPNIHQSAFYSIEKTKNFTSDKNVLVLSPYAILIEHVMLLMNVIKKILPYKQHYVDHANSVFSHVKRSFLNENPGVNKEDITFVGVHVRRTDFLKAITELLKKKTVGEKFFLRSFEYFRQREDLGRPVFLVVSDDPEWVRSELIAGRNQSDVFLVTRGDDQTPGYDIVLLSLCNHTVIDYGSYGFWAAVYAGGEVISTKISHSNVVRSMSKYPNWHFVDVDDEGDFYI